MRLVLFAAVLALVTAFPSVGASDGAEGLAIEPACVETGANTASVTPSACVENAHNTHEWAAHLLSP